jgi:retinol dehydrogenase-14
VRRSSVTANAVHPGVVSTGFGSEDPGHLQRWLIPLIRPLMKEPNQGAVTSVHVATSPDLDGVTGRYFANSSPKRTSRASYDLATTARLWQVSADLVDLPVA